MKKYPLLVVLLVVLALSAVGPLKAQPQASNSAQTFNPEKATNAYLASLSPEAKAKSAAYWNGGYWIQLIDLAVALAIAWLLLASGISRRMRELAERLSKRKPLQTFFMVYNTSCPSLSSLFPPPITPNLCANTVSASRTSLSASGWANSSSPWPFQRS